MGKLKLLAGALLLPALAVSGCGAEEKKNDKKKSETPQSAAEQVAVATYNQAPEQYKLSEFDTKSICTGTVKEAVQSGYGNLEVGQIVGLDVNGTSWTGSLSYTGFPVEGKFPQAAIDLVNPRQFELSEDCKGLNSKINTIVFSEVPAECSGAQSGSTYYTNAAHVLKVATVPAK
jgi:hypothetical protein